MRGDRVSCSSRNFYGVAMPFCNTGSADKYKYSDCFNSRVTKPGDCARLELHLGNYEKSGSVAPRAASSKYTSLAEWGVGHLLFDERTGTDQMRNMSFLHTPRSDQNILSETFILDNSIDLRLG